MFKRMSVVICGAAVTLMTAGYAAAAQTATQEAKDKTKVAADQTGEVITDAAITAAVKTKLLGDKMVGGLKIDVDTKDGVVTLTGPVHSTAERTEAVRLARTTKGVKSVTNKLVMATAATTGRTDKDDKLRIEIKDDTKESAAKVKEASKKAADKVKDTKVEIKDDTTPKLQKAGDVTADAAITSAVKTKFLADTAVGGLKIDVDTKDNVVTLTGTVKSAAEKAEAIRLAKTTKGVKSVVDKLVIQ
jgi:osmotically-inducible protein OsmY